MQSLGKIGRGHLGYFLDLAREDYQERGGERPGYWIGKGAQEFGLEGEVGRDALYNLFDGLSPEGSRRLTQTQIREDRADHRSGWDLTYSAPKSVSILWALGSPDVREAVEACHRQAVAAAMAYLEDESLYTRRGKGGTTLEPSRLVAAAFEHGTSRAGDPNLHTHVLLANVAIRPDGTAGTVHSPNVYHAKMAAGALYQNELASALQERGVALERDRFSFRVADVPKTLEREQSKRRLAIAGSLREGDGPREAARAALRTREAKEILPRAALAHRWGLEASRFGWGREEADRALRPGRDLRPREEQALRAALESGMEEAGRSRPDFNRQEYVSQAARRTVGLGYSAREVRLASRNYLRTRHDIEPQRETHRGTRYGVGKEEPHKEEPGQVRESRREYDRPSAPERPKARLTETLGEHRLASVRSTSFQVGSKPYAGLRKAFVAVEIGAQAAVEAARLGSHAYDRLLEAFVRYTREEGAGRDAVIVAGSPEEADRLNAIAQRERVLDRRVDEAFIRAEKGAFFLMDRVRMAAKNLGSVVDGTRLGTIEAIDPQGAFVKIGFDDGGQLTVPAPMFAAVQLGYSVPAQELTETFSPPRLFVLLDERIGEAFGAVAPERPTNAFQFVVAEAGRALSTRLEHELHRSDAHVQREEKERGHKPRPSRSHEL